VVAGLGALAGVAPATALGHGVASAAGLFVGPVHTSLPLLLVGIGVDDALLVVHSDSDRGSKGGGGGGGSVDPAAVRVASAVCTVGTSLHATPWAHLPGLWRAARRRLCRRGSRARGDLPPEGGGAAPAATCGGPRRRRCGSSAVAPRTAHLGGGCGGVAARVGAPGRQPPRCRRGRQLYRVRGGRPLAWRARAAAAVLPPPPLGRGTTPPPPRHSDANAHWRPNPAFVDKHHAPLMC